MAMEYEEVRLRNRKHVLVVAYFDMTIAVVMIGYFAYKFYEYESRIEATNNTRSSEGKWRGFAEFLFATICIVYTLQLFLAMLLLSSANVTETIENACVKCQVWVCTSHGLIVVLGVEMFIAIFNLIRPGAGTEEVINNSLVVGVTVLKFTFRIGAERFVKAYLKDIYAVPGAHLADQAFFYHRVTLPCPNYYRPYDDNKETDYYDII